MKTGLRTSNFLQVWWRSFLRAFDKGLNYAGILATLLAFGGLSLVGFHYAWVILVILGVLLIGLAFWTKPPFIRDPGDLLSTRLEISAINLFLESLPKIGLLGIDEAGKTTLLDASVNRLFEGKRTEKPYVQVVIVPDSNPTKYICLVDSAGGKTYSQYNVQSLSDRVIIFLDHSTSAVDSIIDEERIKSQEQLISQIALNGKDNKIIVNSTYIVINKSDLWSGDADRESEMDQFGERVRQILLNAGTFGDIFVKSRFSSKIQADVATLLVEVSR